MMFDVWPVYSGERFRASWPSCFFNSSSNFVKSVNFVKMLPSKKACIFSRYGCFMKELLSLAAKLMKGIY